MKKFIALLLCAALLVPFGALSAAAAEPEVNPAFADGENSLIVFVTGIGQSRSYLFGDEYLAEELMLEYKEKESKNSQSPQIS